MRNKLFDFCIFFFISEHDDRDRAPSDITIRKPNKGGNRRVSFKTGIVSASKLNLKRGNIEQGIRAQLEEDDERMVDFDPNKASTFRRRNSPIPGSARNNKAKGLVDGAGWFQVTVSKKKNKRKSFEILNSF